MTTEFDEQNSSTIQENTPEGIDGVSVLSALLLSLLLKVEDRECRVKDTISCQNSPSTDDEAYDKESDTQVLFLDGDVITRHHDGESRDTRSPFEMENVQTRLKMRPDDRADTYYTVNEAEIFVSDSEVITTSSSSIKSELSDENVFLSRYKSEETSSHDVILTTQLERSDTSSNQTYESVYQDSAVRIVRGAMLRAIANIFTNGIIRRGFRSSGQAVQSITDYRRKNWNISINVCNGNEDQEVNSDGYVGQSMVPMSENKNQPKADVISPEWLCDVNRQIAASEVPVDRTDSMPPSLASSCNVSRSSSVDILSSGDRTLKVKATPPSQSKLLWRMVQKMHDSNGNTVLKQPADEDHANSVYDPVNDVRNSEKKVKLCEALSTVTEDPTLHVRLLSEHEKSTEDVSNNERRYDTLHANDRLVKFRNSAAQTENTNFKRADKSASADEVNNNKVTGKEATTTPCPAVTDVQLTKEIPMAKTDKMPQRQIKQRSLPPFANPLLMDVVWRNSSNCNMTAQEMKDMKTSFARGGVREAQRAKSVVELALHRAVSSLLVDKLISESLASLTSQLRITSSFKEAANLTEISPHCFQWFPYLEENSMGPCKGTEQRRRRVEKTNETSVPPKKQGSSDLSDVYQDARENFGSSDDLLINDVKGQTGSSDDDEFTDAVCDSDFSKSKMNTKNYIPSFTDENIQTETVCQIPITVDKATQVTHTAEGKDSRASPSDEIEDDLKRATVEVELPLDSINFIKDQFNDVKVLVAKYRELLYEPLQEDKPVSAVSPAQPKTNLKPNDGHARDAKNIPGRQRTSPELEDDTDEDDDLGNAVAEKPNHKHRRSEKEKGNADVQDKKQTSEDKSNVQEAEETGHPDKSKEQKMDSLDSTQKPKPSEKSDKSKDKRKKRDSSPSRDKGVRRTLKKTGEKRRTGRLKLGTIATEKTTRDGFLPLNVKGQLENSPKSERRKDTTTTKKDPSPSGNSTEKEEEELGTSSKPTHDEKPKVKNRISFFEKFSKHSMKKGRVSAQPSNSTSPELVTPIKQAIMNLEKTVKLSASKQKVGTQKNDDKKHKHKENMHGNKDTDKSRDKTSLGKREDTESGVDRTPGKGIWTNAAFFEALGKADDPKIGTKKSPTTVKRILKDGLLDETRDNENERPATSGENKRLDEKARSRRDTTSKTSPEKTDANSNIASLWKKKKSRNKNTNNQDLTDQVSTTDDSCISKSQCSDSQMEIEKDNANVVKSEEVIIDKKQSSEKLNCDEVMSTEPQITDGSCISNSLCSDKPMEKEPDNADMVKSKEITLNQKQSSERLNSDAEAKKLTDDLSTTNTETEDSFDSPCKSVESSETQNEENSKITLPDEDYDDILDKLSLLNDVNSQEIHSPPPTRDLDDISSLNNFDGPLLASSPRPKRTLQKSNTSSVDSMEANRTSDSTPPILLDDSDDDDDDDEVLHKLRNASFLIACNHNYCENKEDIIKDDSEVGEREDYDQLEEGGPTKSTEYLQSITGVPGTTMHVFTATAHPMRFNHERCGTSSQDMKGAHNTNCRIKSPTHESARATFNKKKSWQRFNFFRKSKRHLLSKSKKMTLQQSDVVQKIEDIGSIPNEEQHATSMVSEDDTVTIATGACTNEEIKTSIDSSLMPVCSQKRKFGFKSLRKSKKT